MSYILDALSKLERKRVRGSVPDLFSVLEPPQRKPNHWKPLAISLALTALLGAILLAMWLLPGKKGGPEKPPSHTFSRPAPSPAGQPVPQKTGPPLMVVNAAPRRTGAASSAEKAGRSVRTVGEPVQPTPSTADGGAATAKAEASPEGRDKTSSAAAPEPPNREGVPAPETGREALSPAPAAAPPAVPEPAPAAVMAPEETSPPVPPETQPPPGDEAPGPILGMNDAPREIRDLAVSGHVFSEDPRTRMIIINNRILRERDTVAEGVTVVEITPEGALLGHRGNRYRIGAAK